MVQCAFSAKEYRDLKGRIELEAARGEHIRGAKQLRIVLGHPGGFFRHENLAAVIDDEHAMGDDPLLYDTNSSGTVCRGVVRSVRASAPIVKGREGVTQFTATPAPGTLARGHIRIPAH